MEEKLRRLEEENERLRAALSEIEEHVREIERTLRGLRTDAADDPQFTDSDVKNLLKKYSRL